MISYQAFLKFATHVHMFHFFQQCETALLKLCFKFNFDLSFCVDFIDSRIFFSN